MGWGTAALKDIIKNVPLFLGRMIAQTSFGAGVPIMLLRLSDFPDLPLSSAGAEFSTTFFEACGPENTFFADSVAFYEQHRFNIFPGGRRYEHPFVTLLRNERPWFCWELAYFKSLIPIIQERKGPQHCNFPDMFGEFLQFFAEWSTDLDGLLVYGPVPTQSGFSVGVELEDTSSFDNNIQGLNEAWGRYEAKTGKKSPLELSNFLSQDRLRRMYHAGGRIIDSQFRANVLRASSAIQLSCAATFQIDFHSEEFEEIRLDLIEDVATAALLRARPTRKTNLTFCFPRTAARRIELSSDRASILIVAPMQNVAHEVLATASVPNDLAFVTSAEGYDEEISENLRELLVHVEDRNTQSVMQQFMLTRHWLNDRFARLSSMYDDRVDPTSIASKNLKDISKWLLKLFDADFAALYNVTPGGGLAEMVSASRGDELSKRTSDENSLHMARLQGELTGELRQHSMCYRAFWNRQTEHVANWNGKLDGSGMASAKPKGNERPRSSLAAPIMIFGKPWGVIELVGFCPNQFDKIARMWLEEASQLIGNALYQTWLLKQITQANLTVLTETRPDGEDDTASRANTDLIERALQDKERRNGPEPPMSRQCFRPSARRA